MAVRCPNCGSKDLWQPRRFKSAWDDVLASLGYERLDCRNCKKRSVFPIEKRRSHPYHDTPDKPETPPPPRVQAPKIEPAPAPESSVRATPTHETTIGKTVVIHGEISGSEFLHVYGELKGAIDLHGNGLLIEPGAKVTATVQAGDIVVQGQLRGGPVITDRVKICRNGSITAELHAASIVVEDGAQLHGKLNKVV